MSDECGMRAHRTYQGASHVLVKETSCGWAEHDHARPDEWIAVHELTATAHDDRSDAATTCDDDSIDAGVERSIRPLVRRALVASSAKLRETTAGLEPDDRRRHQALDRWFAGFAAEVRAHHDVMETLVLPKLAARGALDERTLDTIAADHGWVDHVLSEFGDAIGILAFGLGAGADWIMKASSLAEQLELLLAGQLSRESRLVTPLVSTTLSTVELATLDREVLRGVAVHRAPFALTWLCEHLADGERAELMARISSPCRLLWRSRRRSHRRSTTTAFSPRSES